MSFVALCYMVTGFMYGILVIRRLRYEGVNLRCYGVKNRCRYRTIRCGNKIKTGKEMIVPWVLQQRHWQGLHQRN